jgi:hypothetical protein
MRQAFRQRRVTTTGLKGISEFRRKNISSLKFSTMEIEPEVDMVPQELERFERLNYTNGGSDGIEYVDAEDEEEHTLENFLHADPYVSCNKSRRNRLYQTSHAQIERMKTYMPRSLSSQCKNYDFVKCLEHIACTHNTSVPVVIKSWRDTKYASWWASENFSNNYDCDDVYPQESNPTTSVKLSNDEVACLNLLFK